jgi:H+/Cl- antiporter ClcA
MKGVLTKSIDPSLVSKLYIFWSVTIFLTLVNLNGELITSTDLFWPLSEVFSYLGVAAWASMYFHAFVTIILLCRVLFTKYDAPKHLKIALVYATLTLVFTTYIYLMLVSSLT